MDPDIESCLSDARDREALWTEFVRRKGVRAVAEVGVFRGGFAEALLTRCPGIESYTMIDPWRSLSDWNKPANRSDDEFEEIRREALARTEFASERRTILRGTTGEVSDRVPDGSLDLCYIDADHTLRGITVDLLRMFPKVREGGWIGGDDFIPDVWQHGTAYEPTLVFPFAVHFAEAMDLPIFALPYNQFLICKSSEGKHGFIDPSGRYEDTSLRQQLSLSRMFRLRLLELISPSKRRRRHRKGKG